jgi:hypothetical protein
MTGGTWSPSSTQYAPTYVSGLYNQAIYFNNSTYTGGNSNCYINTTIPASVGLSANSLTCSGWFNFSNTFPSYFMQQLFYFKDSYSNIYMQQVLATTSVINLSTPASSNPSGPTLTNGTWIHTTMVLSNVGMTSSNSMAYYYQNGVYQGSSSNIALTTSFPLVTFVMGNGNGTNNPFWGTAQDFRIYNSALTAAQIQGIYQSKGIPPRLTLTPSNAGLPALQYAWQFEGTLNDSITGLAFNSTGTFTYVAGEYGQGINIQNPTYVASNSMSVTISSPVSSASFTVCAWVNFAAVNNLGIGVFMNLCKAGQANGMRFGLPSSASGPTPQFSWYDDTSTNKAYTYANQSLSTWFHMASTGLNGTVTNYVNGNLGGSVSGSAGINTYNTIVLGNYVFNGFPIQNASIDDLRIYNTALTAAQVKSIYQSGGNLYGASLVQPTYQWPFQGSVVDILQGVYPSSANVGGVPWTVWNSGNTWPYYDSLTQKVGPSSLVLNNTGTLTSNNVQYPVNIPFGGSNSYTVSYWFKWVTTANGPSITYMRLRCSSAYIQVYLGSSSNNVVATFPSSATIPSPQSLATFSNVAGIWWHNSLVFTSSTALNYINGVPGGTSTTAPVLATTANVWTDLWIGSSGSYNFSGTGQPLEIADLRIYNTALTASQIQQIYQSGGAGPSGTLTRSVVYPLAQTSIASSALGLYSTRSLVSTYTGPVVQVRRNSDNTTYNFISDIYGNLSNTQFSTTMDTFLSGTTGNVATWYDQSASAINFTQATASRQPQLVKQSGQWVLWLNRDATPTFFAYMTTSTSLSPASTILYNFNLNSTYNSFQTLLGQGALDNIGFRFNNNSILGDATQNGGGRYGQDFLSSTNSYWYLNGSFGSVLSGGNGTVAVLNPAGNNGIYTNSVWNQVVATAVNGGFTSFNSLNYPVSSLNLRTAYGYMSEMMLFSKAISSQDAQTLWSSAPLSNPYPSLMN